MKMNHSKIADFLSKRNGDWGLWKRNPPQASNYGGVWKRHIRTGRNILSGMLKAHGESLNEESFHTVLVEIENVINSRPLSVDNVNDPNSLKPISPMTLLTQKSKVVYPLPGKFESLARVVKTFPNEMGMIRTVEIELANKSKLVRPMNKIVILSKSSAL